MSWLEILQKPQIHEVITPTFWGSQLWNFIHTIALAYPITPTAREQEEMSQFLTSLATVLPCKTCKDDFSKMLQVNPVDRHLHSREAFARWVNDAHNEVNTKLGKPTMSFEESVIVWTTPRQAKETPHFRPQRAAQVNAARPIEVAQVVAAPANTSMTKVYILLGILALLGVSLYFLKK